MYKRQPYESEDELGRLSDSFETAAGILKKVVSDLQDIVEHFAEGNFDVHSNCPDAYVGQLRNVLDELDDMVNKVSETMHGIQGSSEQVSAGSNQLAVSAQDIAECATSQAAAVEELEMCIRDSYKAKCHKLNRYVAIKVLKQEFSENANFVSKFRIEAQAAAGLMHPNIVNVYDVGEENGIYYIVMELVEGITLKKYIEKKARLSYKEAVSIAIQVRMGIEAVSYTHLWLREI